MTDTGSGLPGGTRGWDTTSFENLFDSAPDAAIVVNGDGQIVLVNGSAEDLFGYSRSELIGQMIELLVPERYRAAHVEQRRSYMREPRKRPMGHPGLDLRGRRKDGSEFPAEIALGPMTSESDQFVTAIIRDVSARGANGEDQRIRDRAAQYAELLRNSFTHLDPAP